MSKSFGASAWFLVKKLPIRAQMAQTCLSVVFSYLLASRQHRCYCRVSFDGDVAAAMDTRISASQAAELSGAALTVVKAVPPPAQADVSRFCLCSEFKDCKSCWLIIS